MMSKLLVPVFLFLISLSAVAQKNGALKLDKDAVVTDGAGGVIPYVVWNGYMKTGEYAVRQEQKDGANILVLFKLSPDQIQLRKEREELLKSQMPKPKVAEAFKEGTKFRFDKMEDLQGKKYDFKRDTGKIVVFNFWFINCPPCKAEIPELNELVAKYKDRSDVVFIGIALDDPYQLQVFQSNRPFLYQIIPDGRVYAQKYNVKSFPTHVIVGKDQLVKYSAVGYAKNTVYWLDKTLREL